MVTNCLLAAVSATSAAGPSCSSAECLEWNMLLVVVEFRSVLVLAAFIMVCTLLIWYVLLPLMTVLVDAACLAHD